MSLYKLFFGRSEKKKEGLDENPKKNKIIQARKGKPKRKTNKSKEVPNDELMSIADVGAQIESDIAEFNKQIETERTRIIKEQINLDQARRNKTTGTGSDSAIQKIEKKIEDSKEDIAELKKKEADAKKKLEHLEKK
jgi:hypothetical protein